MSQDRSLPVAVQLYTLRELPGGFDNTLARVAEVGYPAVETVNMPGASAEEVRDLLQKYNLKVASTHAPLQALQRDLDAVVAFQRTVGNDTLIVPALPQELRGVTAEAWRETGRMLNELGARVQDAGMKFGYHNHAFEMVTIEGRRALDWMFESIDEGNVFVELDLAWVVRGGANPMAMLKQYAGRCARVHVKDLAPEGQNPAEDGWADVGHGILDWDALLPAARTAGAEWYVVEHDRPTDPVTTVRRSLEFLKGRAGLL